jgi:hypothetical protein
MTVMDYNRSEQIEGDDDRCIQLIATALREAQAQAEDARDVARKSLNERADELVKAHDAAKHLRLELAQVTAERDAALERITTLEAELQEEP